MNTLILMTREEAQASHERINTHAASIGHELIRLKDSNGWMHLLDSDGQPFKNWTDYLSRAHGHTRKHMYELMAAAPVLERMAALGHTVNHSQAVVLARFPADLQPVIYQIAAQREGGATEKRLRSIGDVMQEASVTGYVSTPDGEQNAFEAAVAASQRESSITQRYYILKAVPLHGARIRQEDGKLVIPPLEIDISGQSMIQSSTPLLSIWVGVDDGQG